MTFAELVALMVLGGDAPDTVVGVVRHHSPEDEDWTHRVWRRGDLVRRERLDGSVTYINGSGRSWYRDRESGEIVVREDSESSFRSPIGGLGVGGARGSFSRWDGTDFARPTGPVTATEFLGRAAWVVELAPPSHKPYPIQVTVDAATGLVLRDANRDFGSVSEFTEVEIGVEIPDEVFVWDGPAHPPADRNAEHEADMASRREWLDAHGLVLDIPVRPDVILHERAHDTGAFQLSFDASMHGSLVRRPLDDPAAADTLHYRHMYHWRDSRWEWVLGTSGPIADEQLALLKVQLAKST